MSGIALLISSIVLAMCSILGRRSNSTLGCIMLVVYIMLSVACAAAGIYMIAYISYHDQCNNPSYNGIMLFFFPIIFHIYITRGELKLTTYIHIKPYAGTDQPY
jgi:hypothetical protein